MCASLVDYPPATALSMLRHFGEQRFLTPDGVSDEMRKAAADRRGDWQVITHDWVRRFESWSGCTPVFKYKKVTTTVVYTEKEVARLSHLYRHGVRNETKMKTVHANLEQAAETFWPTGSLEHVAMRTLGVTTLVRYLAGHRIRRRPDEVTNCVAGCMEWVRSLAPSKTYINTVMERTPASKQEPVPVSEGKATEPVEASPTAVLVESKEAKKADLEPPKPPSKPLIRTDSSFVGGYEDVTRVLSLESALALPALEPLGLHGGATAEDAEVIADAADRVVSDGVIHKVIGRDYHGADLDRKQVVGVVTAPTPAPPNVYNNSGDNLKAAKIERLDKKKVPYTGTHADRQKIARVINAAKSDCKSKGVFSKARIQKWAEENLHLEEIRSGKWSQKRLEDSFESLMTQAFPEYQFKGAVKLEPMPEGKPPRMLIADGDSGQLMALVVVKCFEDLLFTWMEQHSIKHAAKRCAVQRVVDGLIKPGAKVVEGDGSAWDTTCNADIRNAVENPIIQHIMQEIIRYGVVPEQWHREHLDACERKKIKLFFAKYGEKIRLAIEAIRRSGHRGTSCLNWWENFTNWVCSIFVEPERFLNPRARKGKDETGIMRWFNFAMEGDDSICSLQPPMEEGDAINAYFLEWWKRQGFRMQVVYADKRATFCGYHIACEGGLPTGLICPELPRALKHAGISCSTQIIAAAKERDADRVRDIAAAGALARAAEFAGILPTVSRKYHAYACDVKRSRDVSDREMSIRATGEEGHTFREIEDQIEMQNSLVTPSEELKRLEALGYHATCSDLDAFRLHSWELERACHYKEFCDSLPPSWRPQAQA